MKTEFRSTKMAVAIALLFALILAFRCGLQETDWPTAMPPEPFNGIDGVQYFPANPDNKLASETARLKAARKLKAIQITELKDEP